MAQGQQPQKKSTKNTQQKQKALMMDACSVAVLTASDVIAHNELLPGELVTAHNNQVRIAQPKPNRLARIDKQPKPTQQHRTQRHEITSTKQRNDGPRTQITQQTASTREQGRITGSRQQYAVKQHGRTARQRGKETRDTE